MLLMVACMLEMLLFRLAVFDDKLVAREETSETTCVLMLEVALVVDVVACDSAVDSEASDT